ncbi:MAG: ribosome-associated translation inhibitor RaiA [Clostridia bacterium]
MKIDLTGIHVEVTEGMRTFVNQKVNKLAKFFPEDTIAHVTVATENDKKHVDIRIEAKGHTFLAEETTEDMYAAIDTLTTKIEGQARREKDKNENKRYESVSIQVETEEE